MATGDDVSDEIPYGPPAPYDVSDTYGPNNPFEATPGEPGSYGPPKDVFTSAPSDSDSGASTGGDRTDYTSIFTTVVKTAGEIAKVATQKPLPGTSGAPSGAGGSTNPGSQGPQPPAAPVGSAQTPARPGVSGGAVVAIGLGSVAILTLVALAATRKARRT